MTNMGHKILGPEVRATFYEKQTECFNQNYHPGDYAIVFW